jgi:phospholipid/cholesterol/gamma-HCH transport system ATP-binding protein
MIILHDLWKKYGSLQVLAGLYLEIKTGETIVILGPSGIGKSVLLKHMIGITKPDQGYIDIDGVRITDLKNADLYKAIHNMGMLFQGAALFDSMNIEQNTAFHLNQHGDPKTGRPYTKQEISDRVAHALEMVGLAGTQTKMPSELSGGMRKRAGLARLIVYRPSILLYDEPTTGLDPVTAMQINELIVKIQEELEGTTSVVVTHDIFSALYVGNRLALMKEGKIAYVEDPDSFLKMDDPVIEFFNKMLSQDPRTFKRSAASKS